MRHDFSMSSFVQFKTCVESGMLDNLSLRSRGPSHPARPPFSLLQAIFHSADPPFQVCLQLQRLQLALFEKNWHFQANLFFSLICTVLSASKTPILAKICSQDPSFKQKKKKKKEQEKEKEKKKTGFVDRILKTWQPIPTKNYL